MTINVTFLGLEQIGASLGLAMGSHKDYFTRTGIDREPLTSQRAQKIGAIDRVEYRVPAAVENANIVILSLPVDEVRDMLETIAPLLQPNTLVIDTSPLQSAVIAWAQELLPAERYLVSMTPTLNPAYLEEAQLGIQSAHADLFKNSVMIITSSETTHPDALKLAADLANLAGATPYFAEPAEADGLLAAYDLLPKMAAAGLLAVAANQPSWQEGKKLAGRAFSKATFPAQLLDENNQLGQAALLNRENALRLLDDLIYWLQQMRAQIAENNGDELNKIMAQAVKAREEWFARRQDVHADDFPREKAPSMADSLGRLFGFKPRKK